MNISLAPEILFYIGSFPVSNTFIWSVFVSLCLVLIAVFIKTRLKEIPGKFQLAIEILFDSSYNFVESVVGDKKRAKRIYPYVFTLFLFILLSNLLTFIPGAAFSVEREGSVVNIFRAAMSDYGLVFLLTLITVITTQIVAIAVHGPFGYIGKFFNVKTLLDFFKDLFRGKPKFSKLGQGLLDLFLGIMDIIGELGKIASLSFRLFGNMFAGEVLTAVMLFLVPFFLPLPFIFLGLLTALVQAFVFSVLSLIFITMASEINEDALAEKVTP